MKLQADIAEGVNIINAYTSNSVSVNGQVYTHSILVPPSGEMVRWPVDSLAALTEAHFEQLAQLRPELIIFGTGATLRFAHPSLMRPLMAARIGIETMDTAAACRTFNILVGEGRQAWAALLITP
jgi:uncharacterized protein